MLKLPIGLFCFCQKKFWPIICRALVSSKQPVHIAYQYLVFHFKMSGSLDTRFSQFNRPTQSQSNHPSTSQSYLPSQSNRNDEEGDAEGDVLLSMILKSKGFLVPMTRKFFENNINFETPLDDDMKSALKKHMVDFLGYENQLKMQQNAFSQLEIQAHNLSQNVSDNQNIEEMLEAANLDEKYKEVMRELNEADNFEPTQDKQYKDLLKLLVEESNNFEESDDVEMLETAFTIPVDPFSKQAVVIPVRNTTCGHLYDKESFLKMFETRPKNSVIKCPMIGCANKRVAVEDIEEDLRTQIFIENAKRNQS